MSAAVRTSRLAIRAAAPLLLVLAAATASPAAAQVLASAAPESAASLPAAREEAAELRFEAVVPLPDTLTLADLAAGVPVMLQAVTREGRPVRTAVTWRIVSGDATRIAAEWRTDRDGYATAMLGQAPGLRPRPGRTVIEARTRPRGASQDLTVRLSAVVVRD